MCDPWKKIADPDRTLLAVASHNRALITLTINKIPITVDEGTTVAAAISNAGGKGFRTSVTGAPRGPICGMGICFECRVTIDGVGHQRSCNIIAAEGMEVVTGG